MNLDVIKKVTCHAVAAPVERPFTSSRGWLYKTARLLHRRDRDQPTASSAGASATARRPSPRPTSTRSSAPRIVGRDAVRRRGDLGRPLQPHQGLRRQGHGGVGAERHRHRALGHRRQGLRPADPQADRRRPPHRGHLLRHRPVLHRHGPAGRGSRRGSAGLRRGRLHRGQDEDRPRRPEARHPPRRRGARRDRRRRRA